MRCTVSPAATDSTLRTTSDPRRLNSDRNCAAMAFARSWFACSTERGMVVYTDADMTATESSTVAAKSRRCFLRKLIARPPRAARHRGADHRVADHRGASLRVANLPCADPRAANQPTKDLPAKAPLRSTPAVDPVPSRARAYLPHSPPPNEKAA